MQVKRHTKDTQISARVPTAVKNMVVEMAEEDGMSVAMFLETLCRKEAKKRGKTIKTERAKK